jgi:uncharacterized protein (DUF736 family)
MTYDNNNTGALFKNDKKQTDRHPDYKGSCEINNVQMWVSAWLKKDKNNNTYMSLSFQPKEQQAQTQHNEANAYQPQPAQDDFDDEIPF